MALYRVIPHAVLDLPTSCEDFKRSRTGKGQQIKPQTYIYVSVLKVLEKVLNFEVANLFVFQLKVQLTGILSSYEFDSNVKTLGLFK